MLLTPCRKKSFFSWQSWGKTKQNTPPIIQECEYIRHWVCKPPHTAWGVLLVHIRSTHTASERDVGVSHAPAHPGPYVPCTFVRAHRLGIIHWPPTTKAWSSSTTQLFQSPSQGPKNSHTTAKWNCDFSISISLTYHHHVKGKHPGGTA